MMANFRQIKRVDSQHEMGYVLEFNGELQYLTSEDVEIHLKKYFKLREILKEEKNMRKEFEVIQDAWETYQALVLLHKRS